MTSWLLATVRSLMMAPFSSHLMAVGSQASLRRRQLRYNLAKYKLSRSGRKLKRRTHEPLLNPIEKVSSWHEDITMMAPTTISQHSSNESRHHRRGRSSSAPARPRHSTAEGLLLHRGHSPLVSINSSTTNYSLAAYHPSRVQCSSRTPRGYSAQCWLCLGFAILCAGTLTSTAIFFGYSHLVQLLPKQVQVYRGRFQGDQSCGGEKAQSDKLRRVIHRVLKNSPIASTYRFTEVFAIDRRPDGSLVHFTLHFRGFCDGPNVLKETLKEGLRGQKGCVQVDSLQLGELRQWRKAGKEIENSGRVAAASRWPAPALWMVKMSDSGP